MSQTTENKREKFQHLSRMPVWEPKHSLKSSRNNQELIFASSRLLFFIGYTVLQVSVVPSANLSAQSINLLFWLDKPKCQWKRRGPWGSSWQEDAQWTHDRPAEEVRADRGLGVHIPSEFWRDFEPGRSAAHSLLYVNWRSCVCPMHGWAVKSASLSEWLGQCRRHFQIQTRKSCFVPW